MEVYAYMACGISDSYEKIDLGFKCNFEAIFIVNDERTK